MRLNSQSDEVFECDSPNRCIWQQHSWPLRAELDSFPSTTIFGASIFTFFAIPTDQLFMAKC